MGNTLNQPFIKMIPKAVFVLPGASEDELIRLRLLDVDRDWRQFASGTFAWIVQTYLLLRDTEIDVSLSSSFSRGSLNIAHASTLSGLVRPQKCFVICVQADYPPVRWSQFHIVQNKTQIGPRCAWIPHWFQPGLIPRDSGRAEKIKRVGYFGRPVNHYTRWFRRPSGFFRVQKTIFQICEKLGLELVQKSPENWNDYSDVDVVLGFRSFTLNPYHMKPPTKLFNA